MDTRVQPRVLITDMVWYIKQNKNEKIWESMAVSTAVGKAASFVHNTNLPKREGRLNLGIEGEHQIDVPLDSNF